jgi:hypothetical protein
MFASPVLSGVCIVLFGTVVSVLAFLDVRVVCVGSGSYAFLGFVRHSGSYLVVSAVLSVVLETLVHVSGVFWMGALA